MTTEEKLRRWKKLAEARARLLKEERKKLDQILTDPNYVGGVQFWIKRHDDLLFRLVNGGIATTTTATEPDPCAGCGPICGNAYCPKRMIVTYDNPQAGGTGGQSK